MRNIITAAAVRSHPVRNVIVAAVLIAASVVAFVVMTNPLNRAQPALRMAAVRTSPSAAAVTVTPAAPMASVGPAAAPVANSGVFGCTSSVLTNKKAPLSVYIDALRTGAHPGYDRLTIQFQNGQPGTIQLAPQSGTMFFGSPRGDKVTLAGSNGISILIKNSADAHTAYSGPTDIKTGFSTLLEVRQIQDFEGYVGYGLGIAGPACYHAFILDHPSRLVVDTKTA
jgi:hypothetical protein